MTMTSVITPIAANLTMGRPPSVVPTLLTTDPTAICAASASEEFPPAIAVERAATRARDRSRSSRPTRHDSAPKPAAAASDSVVSVSSTTSITPAPLTQRELDCHLDEHVDGDTLPVRRIEPPLLHGGDRAFVQA